MVVVNIRGWCAYTTNSFKVFVGNDGNNATSNAECGRQFHVQERPNVIQCSKTLHGRHVSVRMRKRWYRTIDINEIEVYREKM